MKTSYDMLTYLSLKELKEHQKFIEKMIKEKTIEKELNVKFVR